MICLVYQAEGVYNQMGFVRNLFGSTTNTGNSEHGKKKSRIDIDILFMNKDIEGLVAAVNDDDYKISYAAILALGKTDDANVIEPLTMILQQNEDWGIRIRAIEAIEEIGGPRVIDALIAAISDGNGLVRKKAIGALANFSNTRVVNAILPFTADSWFELRVCSIEALGKLRVAGAVETIINALQDEIPAVRYSAIKALGMIGGMPSVHALIEIYESDDVRSRNYASDALEEIGDMSIDMLIDVSKRRRDFSIRTFDAISRIGSEKATEALIKTIKEVQGDTRDHAIQALRQIKNTKAVPVLILALNDNDEDVRNSAAAALEYLGV